MVEKLLDPAVLGDSASLTNTLNALFGGEKNRTLNVFKDYYNGKHFLIEDGYVNKTRSGHQIGAKAQDNYFEGRSTKTFVGQFASNRRGRKFKFHKDQMATINYIQQFILKYIDVIKGQEQLSVSVNEEFENSESINESLSKLWPDLNGFIETQINHMLLGSVAVARLTWDASKSDYKVVDVDPVSVYPLYLQGEIDGYLLLQKARSSKGVEVFNGLFIYPNTALDPNLVEKHYYHTIIEDSVVTTPNEPLVAELDFNNLFLIPNLENPFNNFSYESTENTEVTEWISLNDQINISRTFETLVNQTTVWPQVDIDVEKARMAGVDTKSQGYKELLRDGVPFPWQLSSVPFQKTSDHHIPKEFYIGQDRLIEQLYQSSSLSKALLGGDLSNVSEETVKLTFRMLESKIKQKRSVLNRLIAQISTTYLKKVGLVSEETEFKPGDFQINWPDVVKQSNREKVDDLKNLFDSGVVTEEFMISESLTLLGYGDKVEEVLLAKKQQSLEIANRANSARRSAKQALNSQREVDRKSSEKRKVEELNDTIATLT